MDRPPAASSPPSGAWPSRRTLAALLVLLAATIAVSYWVEIVSNAFNDVDPIVHVPNYDFFQYYAGGHNWNMGLDPYLNHPNVPGAIEHPRFDTHQISGFIYPPTLLPVYGALAHYSYNDARRAWLAITLSAFALLVAVAVWVTPGRRLEVLGVSLLLTVASYPFIYHVHNGQADLLSAALAVSGFLLYPRWRGWPSAALLALAIATKVTPVLLLAVMVVYFRDWRLAVKALVCGLVLFAGSLAWVHIGLYREFLFTTLPSIAVSDPSQFNQTVLRFWWKYPPRAEDHLGARLPRAAVPGVRGEPQPGAPARCPKRPAKNAGASATPCCCSRCCSCCSSRRSPGRWRTSGPSSRSPSC